MISTDDVGIGKPRIIWLASQEGANDVKRPWH
jgi:hypothetical protein